MRGGDFLGRSQYLADLIGKQSPTSTNVTRLWGYLFFFRFGIAQPFIGSGIIDRAALRVSDNVRGESLLGLYAPWWRNLLLSSFRGWIMKGSLR